jgi:hypothetical protein
MITTGMAAARSRVAAFFVLMAAACGPDPADFTRAKLQQAIQTRPQRIPLAEYVTGTWDRVCFFAPYMQSEFIATTLGFAWPEALDTGIEKGDTHTLLVFTNGQTVAQHVMFERTRGDFSKLSPRCFKRNDAVFRVTTPDRTYYRELGPWSTSQ